MAAAIPLRKTKMFMPIYFAKPNLSANSTPIDVQGEEVEHGNTNNNSTLISLCKQNRLKEALHVLQGMYNPDSSAYISLLQACIHNKRVPQGKIVHAHIIHSQFQFHDNILLGNRLVTLYSKCGHLDDARKVFDEMPERDVVSWTAMISAYLKQGLTDEALRLFYQMRLAGAQPNEFTFSSVLPACASMAALEHGKEIHTEIIRSGLQSNVFVGCALVDMYMKCGCMDLARKVFDEMPDQNVVSWTAMTVGYAQNGSVDEALRLFRQMPNQDVVSWSAMIAAFSQHGLDQEALRLFYEMQTTGVLPNQFTFASVLSACANLGALEHGKVIHGGIIRRRFQADPFLQCAMVDMYVKCGSMGSAQMVLDGITERSVALWNAMIAGYAQSGDLDKAMELFQEMPERDVISWNAIIAGYAQNGLVDEALKFFQLMPERNVVSWTQMIAACAQSGHSDESLKLFQQMHMIGVDPDSDTFASILTACSNLSALEHGKKIHGDIIQKGFLFDVFTESALLDMYAKCGSIQYAKNTLR
jgi:pentatricopeptide repeat protein